MKKKKIRLLPVLALILGSMIAIWFYQIDKNTQYLEGTVFTPDNISEVYNKILRASGSSPLPPLTVLDSDIINAWTDGKTITITTGMLKIFHNQDELAMVLGHELAHFMARDPFHNDMKGPNMEANADKLGAYMMMRAGFNPCKGREIMATFIKLFGDVATPVSHPSNAYRFDQLDLPMCHSIFS